MESFGIEPLMTPEGSLRWYAIAVAAFFGVVLLAILVQPVWLATVVLLAGLFGSGTVWILTMQAWRRSHRSARWARTRRFGFRRVRP
jgi:hypothetical protein